MPRQPGGQVGDRLRLLVAEISIIGTFVPLHRPMVGQGSELKNPEAWTWLRVFVALDREVSENLTDFEFVQEVPLRIRA